MYMELLFILVLAMDISVTFYQQWLCLCAPQWSGTTESARYLQNPSLGIPISWWFSLSCSRVWLSGNRALQGPDRPSSLWSQRELKPKILNEEDLKQALSGTSISFPSPFQGVPLSWPTVHPQQQLRHCPRLLLCKHWSRFLGLLN